MTDKRMQELLKVVVRHIETLEKDMADQVLESMGLTQQEMWQIKNNFFKSQIVFKNIDWDAPESVDLPQTVVIDLNNETKHWVDDLPYGEPDEQCGLQSYMTEKYGYRVRYYWYSFVE